MSLPRNYQKKKCSDWPHKSEGARYQFQVILQKVSEDFQTKIFWFLNIATASLFEYQTQIEIAKNINYINEQEFNNLYKSSRELEAMIKSFTNKIATN